MMLGQIRSYGGTSARSYGGTSCTTIERSKVVHVDLWTNMKQHSRQSDTMTEVELIDAHVSVQQCKRAIDALHAYATKLEEKRAETELLPGREQHIWLQITVKTMHPEQKLKPFRMYVCLSPR